MWAKETAESLLSHLHVTILARSQGWTLLNQGWDVSISGHAHMHTSDDVCVQSSWPRGASESALLQNLCTGEGEDMSLNRRGRGHEMPKKNFNKAHVTKILDTDSAPE